MNEETAKQDLEKFEKDELTSPGARKIVGDRVVYTSRPLVPPVYRYGRPVLCDFGEARFGEYNNMANIQPNQYRAPEVILEIPWDEKVDIWNVGVMVSTTHHSRSNLHEDHTDKAYCRSDTLYTMIC